MAQHIQSSWDGILAIHRYEDLALIRQVIEAFRPFSAIELGTAEGGFAAFLTAILKEWDGAVLSVDFKQYWDAKFAERYAPWLTLCIGDLLDESPHPLASEWCARENVLLYTDNGHKQRELELYVPLLGQRALVGTHDYGTEVDPAWAEPFMAAQGFTPHRHAEFAALAHPDYYPDSLTRFWVRTPRIECPAVPHDPGDDLVLSACPECELQRSREGNRETFYCPTCRLRWFRLGEGVSSPLLHEQLEQQKNWWYVP